MIRKKIKNQLSLAAMLKNYAVDKKNVCKSVKKANAGHGLLFKQNKSEERNQLHPSREFSKEKDMIQITLKRRELPLLAKGLRNYAVDKKNACKFKKTTNAGHGQLLKQNKSEERNQLHPSRELSKEKDMIVTSNPSKLPLLKKILENFAANKNNVCKSEKKATSERGQVNNMAYEEQKHASRKLFKKKKTRCTRHRTELSKEMASSINTGKTKFFAKAKKEGKNA